MQFSALPLTLSHLRDSNLFTCPQSGFSMSPGAHSILPLELWTAGWPLPFLHPLRQIMPPCPSPPQGGRDPPALSCVLGGVFPAPAGPVVSPSPAQDDNASQSLLPQVTCPRAFSQLYLDLLFIARPLTEYLINTRKFICM